MTNKKVNIELDIEDLLGLTEPKKGTLDYDLNFIINNGYDEFYGARPLKRLVNKELETPLAKLLINGDIHENDTLIVSYDNKLIINKKNSD